MTRPLAVLPLGVDPTSFPNLLHVVNACEEVDQSTQGRAEAFHVCLFSRYRRGALSVARCCKRVILPADVNRLPRLHFFTSPAALALTILPQSDPNADGILVSSHTKATRHRLCVDAQGLANAEPKRREGSRLSMILFPKTAQP